MLLRMMFSIMAAVALTTTTSAQITLDGSIDDWPVDSIASDRPDDNAGEAELLRWGCLIENGFFYGFMELDKAIAPYTQSTNDIWAGFWINVDNLGGEGGPGNGSNITDPSALNYTAGQLSDEWDEGYHQGFDIDVEWGGNTNHWGDGQTFFGNNDMTAGAESLGSVINGGDVAYSGNIFEVSCPVNEIIAELARYPDNVTAGNSWRVGAYVEASINEVGPWGQDNSDTVLVISRSLPGDVNGDGAVNGSDLDIIRANWGQTVTPGDLGVGDLDADGTISGGDLDIVRANWGAASAAAPEPSLICLGLIGLAVLIWKRSR